MGSKQNGKRVWAASSSVVAVISERGQRAGWAASNVGSEQRETKATSSMKAEVISMDTEQRGPNGAL